jgi:hypothetical protein
MQHVTQNTLTALMQISAALSPYGWGLEGYEARLIGNIHDCVERFTNYIL